MQTPIYYPVLLYPQGLEYDRTKKRFALFALDGQSIDLLVQPSENLQPLADFLRNKDYALNFRAGIDALSLDGKIYTVSAFNSQEMTDFRSLF